MKVKVLSRNPADYIRENKSDIHKLHRNLDPSLHPFEGPREYTRALNAVKLERVFAKPFVSSLDGHTDGVNCIARHPRSLSVLLSGSCDGEIRLWSLPRRECLRTLTAHSGFVRGLCVNSLGDTFISIGDDKVIKQWSMEQSLSASASSPDPVNTIIGKNLYHGIDHHWKSAVFATCGEQVDIWDEHRAEPVRSFTWGVDTIHSVKFNPVETHLLASTASDRSIILYDMRGSTPLRKVVMEMRSNTVAWNPLESFIFTAANEDSNLYTFDIRRFNQPINVHMDHVSAVLDVDYSPTGQEFVTGSFDKTIRIYSRDSGRSRCITHEECNACFVFDSVRIPLTSFQEAMKQISEYGKLMLHKNWERLLHGKKQRLTTMPSLRKDSNITLNSSELRGIVTSLRLCSKRPRRKRSYWLQERERRITFVSIVNQEVFHMSPKERNTLSLLSSERTHDHAMCVSGIM